MILGENIRLETSRDPGMSFPSTAEDTIWFSGVRYRGLHFFFSWCNQFVDLNSAVAFLHPGIMA
jgi:hypothetical protein